MSHVLHQDLNNRTAGPREGGNESMQPDNAPSLNGGDNTFLGLEPLPLPAHGQGTTSTINTLLETIRGAVIEFSRLHITSQASNSSLEAIIALVNSTIAATFLLCVLGFQLFWFALSMDNFLLRLNFSIENMFSNVSAQLQEQGSLAAFSSVCFKSLLKMMWLIIAYRFKFADLRQIFLCLTTIRVVIEQASFAINHRDDPIVGFNDATGYRRMWLMWCCLMGICATVIMFESFHMYAADRFNVLEQMIILLVWLGEPTTALIGAVLQYSRSSEQLQVSITALHLDIAWSVCLYLITVVIFFQSYFGGSYWSHCLLFHYAIVIMSAVARLLQLRAIQWQLITKFKALTREEVAALPGDELCPICLHAHVYPGSVSLPCGHLAHSGCLVDMLKASAEARCPLCRAQIPLYNNNNNNNSNNDGLIAGHDLRTLHFGVGHSRTSNNTATGATGRSRNEIDLDSIIRQIDGRTQQLQQQHQQQQMQQQHRQRQGQAASTGPLQQQQQQQQQQSSPQRRPHIFRISRDATSGRLILRDDVDPNVLNDPMLAQYLLRATAGSPGRGATGAASSSFTSPSSVHSSPGSSASSASSVSSTPACSTCSSATPRGTPAATPQASNAPVSGAANEELMAEPMVLEEVAEVAGGSGKKGQKRTSEEAGATSTRKKPKKRSKL